MADTVDGLVAMRFGHRNPKRCGQKTAEVCLSAGI